MDAESAPSASSDLARLKPMRSQTGADGSHILSCPPAMGNNAREQPGAVRGDKAVPNYTHCLMENFFPSEKLLDGI